MLLALHGLSDDYSHVSYKILGSTIVSSFTFTCSTLLCVPSKPINDITAFVEDSSALVSQHGECNGRYKLDKVHYKYEHCYKLGHKIVRCYALHGHPPRSDLTIN